MGGFAEYAPYALGPIGVAGKLIMDESTIDKQGSTIPMTAGTPGTGNPYAPDIPTTRGFIESMGGWQGRAPMFARPDRAAMPPPPPPQWVYDPQKGASWATPKRQGTSTEYSFEAHAPGSEGFNSYRGNRI